MKKFKNVMKRTAVGLLSAALLFSSVDLSSLTVKAAGADDKYEGEYTIESILSQYEYFVSGDVDLNNHTVAAVAVGGKLSQTRSFGQAAQYPSYVGKSDNLIYDMSDYKGINTSDKGKILYYLDGQIANWEALSGSNSFVTSVPLNNPYFDFTKMSDIQKQADSVAAASHVVQASEINSGVLTVDFSVTPNITIPYSLYTDGINTLKIRIVNVPESNFDFWKENAYSISVTGVNGNNIKLDGYNQIKINDKGCDVFGKLMGDDRKEIYMGGMNLVWLFPDAEGKVEPNAIYGHVVAPLATVNPNGGGFEGGVIAKKVITGEDAEGHYHPYKPGNSLPVTEVSIQGLKKDDSDNVLKNAKFGLYSDEACTKLVKEAISDDNGIFKFEKIKTVETASYWVKEISAPTGYNINTNKYRIDVPAKTTGTKNVDGGNAIINVKKTTPTPKYVTVKGIKNGKDNATGVTAPLAGAKFGLYSDATCTTLLKEATSISDGTFAFDYNIKVPDSGLENYYVKEISAPNDYIKDNNPYTITVNSTDANGAVKNVNNGNAIINEKKTTPTPKYVTVKGLKNGKDNATGVTAPLAGAKFGLYSDATCSTLLKEATSISDGTFAFDYNIKVPDTGSENYYVKEISAPTGYDIDISTYKVTVYSSDANGAVKNVNDGYALINYKTTIPPKKYVNIAGIKHGKENEASTTSAALAGAEFGLFKSLNDEQLGTSVKSDANGKFIFNNIEVLSTDVEYYVKEISAPAGYRMNSAKYPVMVYSTCNDGDTLMINSGAPIYNYENPGTGDGEFAKLTEDGKELAGATIQLTCNDPSVDLSMVTMREGSGGTDFLATKTKISWVSTDKRVLLTGLPDGTYKMTENLAPFGYNYSDDISFIMKNGRMYDMNNNMITVIKMVDTAMSDPYTGKLIGNKTDGAKGVAGAALGLYSDSECKNLVQKTVSGSDGKFEFTELKAGKYYVKEIEAPAGYKLSEKVYGPYDVEAGKAVKMEDSVINEPITPPGNLPPDNGGNFGGGDGGGKKPDNDTNLSGKKSPKTGENNTPYFIFGGSALLVIAAGLYLLLAKRKEENN